LAEDPGSAVEDSPP